MNTIFEIVNAASRSGSMYPYHGKMMPELNAQCTPFGSMSKFIQKNWTYIQCDGLQDMFMSQAGIQVKDCEVCFSVGSLADFASKALFRLPWDFIWMESENILDAPEDRGKSGSRTAIWITQVGKDIHIGVYMFHKDCFWKDGPRYNLRGEEGMLLDWGSVQVSGSDYQWDVRSALTSRGSDTKLVLDRKTAGNDESKFGKITLIHVAWAIFFLQLLHCKNISCRDREEQGSRQVRRAREREGLPKLIFKQLIVKVPGIGKEYVLGETGDGSGYHTPLHVVRGHIRKYSPEKPMFGKLTGQFWIPNHVRGDASDGVIEKDYLLQPVT